MKIIKRSVCYIFPDLSHQLLI